MASPVDPAKKNGSSLDLTHLNLTVTRTYNERGKVLAVNDECGNITRYQYNDQSRRTQITELAGTSDEKVTTYTYHPNTTDDQGSPVLGKVASVDGPQPGDQDTTRYQYSAQGLLTRITDALGYTIHSDYNAAGQRISATDTNGIVTTFAYNSRNRLIAPAARATPRLIPTMDRIS